MHACFFLDKDWGVDDYYQEFPLFFFFKYSIFHHTISRLLYPDIAFFLMLQGLKGQNSAFQTLKTVESFFLACGSCRSDTSSFSVHVSFFSRPTNQNPLVFPTGHFLMCKIYLLPQVTLSNEQIFDLIRKNLCDSDLPSSVSTSIEHLSGEQNFSISVRPR